MRAVIKKRGNTASLHIPTAVMQAAQLELGEVVEVREEDGRIVIEPLRRRKFALEELVNRITPANRHEEINFGGPVGASDVLR